MAKRVMRSNRRTQRRRGSQLKHRGKRSKLLKRTLKRRNSFRKKNTYKRRKTMMKRGGRTGADDPSRVVETDSPSHEVDLGKFVDDFNKGEYMKIPKRLSNDLTALLNDEVQLERGVRVIRNTYMGNEKDCKIDRVDENELFVYFKDEGSCTQIWKRPSKFLRRKHGISLTHLMNNYNARVMGNDNAGNYLEFTRKSGRIFFKDD